MIERARRFTEESHEPDSWREQARRQTVATLPEFVRHLAEDYRHTYSTIVSAIVAAAIGAANAVERSPRGGITGFQDGFIGLSFYREWMDLEEPFRVMRYGNLLYPQYDDYFEKSIPKEIAIWVRQEAAKLLMDHEYDSRSSTYVASPMVVAHWDRLLTGWLPFGFAVKDER